MTLTVEEQEYLQEHPMCKKLQNGPDSEVLWQTLYGARTLSNAIYVEKVYAAYHKRLADEERNRRPPIQVSDELERRNERCIDEFGCGMFGD